MTDWRKDHWKARETEAEHAERVENADREARWYWDQAVWPQQTRYTETMNYLAPLRGPYYERKRADALRLFREQTKDAAALYDETAAEIMRDGEVSELTSGKWDELVARNVIQQAAE